MDSPLNQDWLDEVAQRRLTAEEAAQWRRLLSERPSEARRLEEELALNQLLDSRSRPVVSSNFTARVLSGIQESPEQESGISRWWAQGVARVWSVVRFFSGTVGRIWAHSIPIAVAVVCVAIPLNWGWQRVQVHRNGTMARTAAELSVAAAMPGVAVLQDFEAVQLLETRSAPDDVTLMQALREDVP
jgi:anti-sigma factor RsiW